MSGNGYRAEQVRILLAGSGMSLVCLLLLGCLFRTQILRGHVYERAHRTQSVDTIGIPARRGSILDRHGRVISEDVAGFGISLHAERLRCGYESAASTAGSLHSMAVRAAVLLGLDAYESVPSEEAIRTHLQRDPQLPFLLWDSCSESTLAIIAEHQRDFPALVVHRKWVRRYAYPEAFCHIAGFTGWDLVSSPGGVEFDLAFPRQAGRMGIERAYDPVLRGQAGYRVIRKDACGFPVAQLAHRDPIPGCDVCLTLDAEVQSTCRELLAGVVGAVVVMDVFTGELLAACSSPTFSLSGITSERWGALCCDRLNPLLNRALSGQYPMGSTIKPLVLMTAIQHGLVSPGGIVYVCHGGYRVGRRVVHCYHHMSHGALTPREFLARSCNGCSCYLGSLVGPALLCEQAAALGFGSVTGVELPDVETPGYFPKASDFGDGRLGPGEFANICLGQSITVTPLQSVRYAAALANGGKVLKPVLVLDAKRSVVPTVVAEMQWTGEAWQTVMGGMIDVVNARRGTGRAARLGTSWPQVAGKTGTADVPTPAGNENVAWMIAFGPSDGVPRYAVSMVVEHGRSGGATVAPRVKRLMAGLFEADGSRRDRELMARH